MTGWLRRHAWRIAAYVLVIASFAIVVTRDYGTISDLAVEDGPIEKVGALSFLAGAMLFFAAYLRSAGKGLSLGRLRTNRNLFYLILGLGLFFAFGEEISWGQRIFGWSTPGGLAEANMQGETNVHNLGIFHVLDAEGEVKSGLALLFSFNRLFTVFVLGFGVLLPLGDALVRRSRRIRSLIDEQFRVPVPDVWIAPLIVTTFVATRIAIRLLPIQEVGHLSDDMYELKEAALAFALALIAFAALRKLPAR